MKYLFIITFLIVTSGVTVVAQEKGWTLDECMRYAVKNAPKASMQSAQNSIYYQDYLEAVGKLLPNINASTSADFRFGRSEDDDTGGYTDVNSFGNTYAVSGSVVLFDGLANISKIKMQKVNKLMGKQQLQQTKDLIAYETMEAYFNVLYYIDMVKLAEQQLEESSDNLKQVKRMEELGVKGFPDVAEMQAKEAADNYNLTKQKNQLAIGIIQLKAKMNFPIDEDIVVVEYGANIVISKIQEPALDIYKQSLGYTPKALAAESALKATQLAYKSVKGQLYPTLSAYGGYSTSFFRYMDGSDYNSFSKQLDGRSGYSVGFTLSVPIFTGFSRSANVKRSKAQVVIAQAEHDEKLRTLYSEIEQAVTDMNGQVDEYYQAKKQVDAMQVAHNVNQRKYTEGLINPIELYTSSNRLLQAKTQELNARLKYELKSRLVNYYKGESFITE